MKSVKCFDVVEAVVGEFMSDNASNYIIEKNRFRELEKYCGFIDEITESNDVIQYDVYIDDKTYDVIVSMVCKKLEISERHKSLRDILDARKIKVAIALVDGDHLRVDFVFSNIIWIY